MQECVQYKSWEVVINAKNGLYLILMVSHKFLYSSDFYKIIKQ